MRQNRPLKVFDWGVQFRDVSPETPQKAFFRKLGEALNPLVGQKYERARPTLDMLKGKPPASPTKSKADRP